MTINTFMIDMSLISLNHSSESIHDADLAVISLNWQYNFTDYMSIIDIQICVRMYKLRLWPNA